MRQPAARLLGSALESEFLQAIHPIRPEGVVVRPAPRWLRALWGRETRAMTIGSTILIDPEALALERLTSLLKHELVHVRQWRQLGPVRFLSRYIRQYLVGRFGGAGHRVAYLAIDLEAEARRLAR
ncbi:MAG: DUF4157 domain-containing protein [Actinobacteria bacterium]|nr:MAG: DUF4157 domain-containing protein [Actinomycetota bacterium]